VPVTSTVARKGLGLDELKRVIADTLSKNGRDLSP